MPLRIQQHGSDVLLWIKAVPGASRDQLAGPVGDRLKIRIAAAPEAGKANSAICKLLAEVLGIRANRITIESGQTNPAKIVRIAGANIEDVRPAVQ